MLFGCFTMRTDFFRCLFFFLNGGNWSSWKLCNVFVELLLLVVDGDLGLLCFYVKNRWRCLRRIAPISRSSKKEGGCRWWKYWKVEDQDRTLRVLWRRDILFNLIFVFLQWKAFLAHLSSTQIYFVHLCSLTLFKLTCTYILLLLIHNLYFCKNCLPPFTFF